MTVTFFTRVDVTEEFPFLVTKMSPYDDRGRVGISKRGGFLRAEVVEAAFPRSTLPTCGPANCCTVIVYEPCGSPLPDAPPPLCPAGTKTECDYVCTWPSGIKGTM